MSLEQAYDNLLSEVQKLRAENQGIVDRQMQRINYIADLEEDNLRLKTALDGCIKKLNITPSELRLLCGEMTAQEIRTVRAVLANRIAMIRREME